MHFKESNIHFLHKNKNPELETGIKDSKHGRVINRQMDPCSEDTQSSKYLK